MKKPKSTNLSIRMEIDLKKEAEELFGNLGMNLTTAFNIFVRQSLQVKGLPFSVRLQTEMKSGSEKQSEACDESDAIDAPSDEVNHVSD